MLLPPIADRDVLAHPEWTPRAGVKFPGMAAENRSSFLPVLRGVGAQRLLGFFDVIEC